MRDGPFVLLVQFPIYWAPAMSELGMRKVQIPSIMTSPEREAPKTSTKRSAALRSQTGITPAGIYPVLIAIKGGGRPARR